MRVIFLLCFSRGNTLTPYSKSVPAVIAKASAIYNPIIYAIIHPRYRYSKHIGMCITVHVKVFFTMNDLPSFPQPHPMGCVVPPCPPHDGIRVVRPCTTSTWYRVAQTAHGAPDVASRCGQQRRTVPSSTFLPPHNPALSCGAAQHRDSQEEAVMLRVIFCHTRASC